MENENQVTKFLGMLADKTGNPVVNEVATIYRTIFFENTQPGMPADATRQIPVIDYKHFMGTVAHAPSGTNQPDVAPQGAPVNTRCTRDTGEETAKENWRVPEFADPANLKNTVKRLLDNGKRNQMDRPEMPANSFPLDCGDTVTNRRNMNGVDAGYQSGGGAAGGAQ